MLSLLEQTPESLLGAKKKTHAATILISTPGLMIISNVMQTSFFVKNMLHRCLAFTLNGASSLPLPESDFYFIPTSAEGGSF